MIGKSPNEKMSRCVRLSVRAFPMAVVVAAVLCTPAFARVTWIHKSSTTADLPVPCEGQQQTCCVVFDIDKDGVDDFIIGERTKTPSVGGTGRDFPGGRPLRSISIWRRTIPSA